VLTVVLAVIAVLSLAGCNEAQQSTKDTIIICMAQQPDTMYPMASLMTVRAEIGHAWEPRGWVYDDAYFYTTQMLVDDEFPTLENGGATLTDDILTVTFRFKPEIKWSDGEPFTVDDILFTRDVLLDPASGAMSPGIYEQMTFEKIDDNTLKVTYPKGTMSPTYFLPDFGGPNAAGGSFLPRHMLEDVSPADIVDSEYARTPKPVLGPYEPVEWVDGVQYTLKAVDNWWGGEVKIPNLVYRFITDTNELLASVLAGECDFATSDGLGHTQIPLIQQLASEGAVQYAAIPSLVWEHIDMQTWPVEPGIENHGLPFFADVRVRQAVAYGTDRQHMADELLYGEVKPLSGFLPDDHWAWNPELEDIYPFDPEKARALLAEAGWEDIDGDGILEATSDLEGEYSCDRGSWTIPEGTKFEVAAHTTTGAAFRPALMAIFVADMADIGIRADLDMMPASDWFADDGPLSTRKFQIGNYASVIAPYPDQLPLYGGMNVYKYDPGILAIEAGPTGPYLTAQKLLEAAPDLLDGTDITEEMFFFGRAVDANPDIDKLQFLKSSLPDGLKPTGEDPELGLFYVEQIPQAKDDYEGQNTSGWCSAEATQLMFDAQNVLGQESRLPYYQELQMIFAEEVPSLPLTQRIEVEVWAKDLCGPHRGPTSYASWNVETWHFGMCE